jgi:hypothetical protein
VTTASPEALVTRSANSDSRFRCSISPVVTLSFFTIVETSTGTRSIRTDTICEAEAGRGAAAGATRLSLRSSPQSSHAKGDCASLDTVPSALPLRSSPQSSHAKGNSNSCFSRAVASAVALGVPLTVRMPAASGGTLPAAGKDNGDELLLLVDDAVDCGDGGDDVCIVATQKARGSITKSERVSQQRSFVTRVPPALKFTLALHSSALTQSFSYVAVPPRRLTTSLENKIISKLLNSSLSHTPDVLS